MGGCEERSLRSGASREDMEHAAPEAPLDGVLRERRTARCEGGVVMLRVGDRSPAMVVRLHDGRKVDLGAPGRRTALWFSPKGGRFDEYFDRLIPSLSG